MAPPVDINYWAVLVSGIFSMVLGSLWYGPLFGKQWMHMMGMNKPERITPSMKKEMIKSYTIMFLGSLLTAFVLAHYIDYAQAATVSDGLSGGVWVWLGFVVPISIGSVLWERKPFKLFLINSGFHLVNLLVVGVILTIW